MITYYGIPLLNDCLRQLVDCPSAATYAVLLDNAKGLLRKHNVDATLILLKYKQILVLIGRPRDKTDTERAMAALSNPHSNAWEFEFIQAANDLSSYSGYKIFLAFYSCRHQPKIGFNLISGKWMPT